MLTTTQRAEFRQCRDCAPPDTTESIRAKVLLLADESSEGPAKADTEIAALLGISQTCAFTFRQKFANPEFISRRNRYARERWNNSLAYKVKSLLGHRLREALKRQLRRKKQRTATYLGCSIEEFIGYLETRFKRGMNWSNFGPRGWHLDHVKPCAAFDLSKDSELSACFHYTNYQPLWAKQNVRKSSKWNGKHWKHEKKSS